MPTYKYHPYYEYNGPSRAQPFREELSEDEVKGNIALFFEHIGSCFEEIEAVIEPIGEDVVAVTTSVSEADCDERVKRCLNSLDLFARKVK